MEYVYHVTTASGLAGMSADGIIDPEKSRGKRKASWFVPAYKLGWAVCHVMVRHEVELEGVYIVRVNAEGMSFLAHGGTGLLYRCLETNFPGIDEVMHAQDWAHTGEFEFAGNNGKPEVSDF